MDTICLSRVHHSCVPAAGMFSPELNTSQLRINKQVPTSSTTCPAQVTLPAGRVFNSWVWVGGARGRNSRAFSEALEVGE